jgi:hypothetical protein
MIYSICLGLMNQLVIFKKIILTKLDWVGLAYNKQSKERVLTDAKCFTTEDGQRPILRLSSIDRAPNDTKNVYSIVYYHFRRASPVLWLLPPCSELHSKQ